MKPSEAAKLLRTAHQTILNYIKKGHLKARKKNGQWKMNEKSVQAILDKLCTASKKEKVV